MPLRRVHSPAIDQVSLSPAADTARPAEEDPVVIDFSTSFARLPVMPTLRRLLGRELPDPNAESSIPELLTICRDIGLEVSPPRTLAHVWDKLIGHVIEPLCIQPTFITDHPECLSPLAKSYPSMVDGVASDKAGLTQRFELFVGGKELCNAYSELNDPAEQHRRLSLQAQAAAAGDEEALPNDADFVQALSYGLPPTAGWGLGIDRLAMLLTGQSHIREVLAFPVLRSLAHKS